MQKTTTISYYNNQTKTNKNNLGKHLIQADMIKHLPSENLFNWNLTFISDFYLSLFQLPSQGKPPNNIKLLFDSPH